MASPLVESLLRRMGYASVDEALKDGAQQGVKATADFQRIQGLPRRALDLQNTPDLTPLFLRADAECSGCPLCRGGTPKLWPIQSAALLELEQAGGLLAPIGVGHGKTGLSLLAGAVSDNWKRVVLLVPPAMQAQLLSVDIPNWSRHYEIPLDKLSVVSYSKLSTAKSADILDKLEPDLIIADECHKLRHKTAACTKRFLRYMKEHPGCAFVGMSGTITNRSVRDYAHLSHIALRNHSPLPFNYFELSAWAQALDASEDRRPAGALRAFCDSPTEDVRDGFRRRLVQTPGVVATDDGAIGTSLILEKATLTLPDSIEAHLRKLLTTWTTAAGEELDSPLALWRHGTQLTSGFYYKWDPAPDPAWLDARNNWAKVCRRFLTSSRARDGLDSPLLLARAADREPCKASCAKYPGDVCSACGRFNSPEWFVWTAYKSTPPPPTVPVWLDPYLVDYVKDWLAAGPGIVWYLHEAVGHLISTFLDLPLFAGGDDLALANTDAPSIVASIHAHGTGKNLQRWNRNLITTPPTTGTVWEQLLARTHRPGQLADEVTATICLQSDYHTDALDQAFIDADYIQATQGQKQKLLFATRTWGGA